MDTVRPVAVIDGEAIVEKFREKRCARCGEWWPADEEFFHRLGGRRLHSYCKACVTERVYELRHGAQRKIARRKMQPDQGAEAPASRLEEGSGMTHVWFWRSRLPDRKGQACRVLARSKRMGSVLVEFADGYRVITSRRAVRRMR